MTKRVVVVVAVVVVVVVVVDIVLPSVRSDPTVLKVSFERALSTWTLIFFSRFHNLTVREPRNERGGVFKRDKGCLGPRNEFPIESYD